MMFMCLALTVSIGLCTRGLLSRDVLENSYKGQTAVSTPADLGLVHVDEDFRMSQWSSTSITGYHPCLCPSYGLLVNETDGGFWLRLCNPHESACSSAPAC